MIQLADACPSVVVKKLATLTFLIISLLCAQPARAVEFEWATVGNPGNGPDTTGFGAVSYVYRISKHEVTNAQYAEFLNAVDPTGANALGLHNSGMSSYGGINRSFGPNGSWYQVKPGRGNNPVNQVSFFDAMRFTNWLQNGQGSGSTESGVYTISTGTDEIRSPSATYFIPSADEWYKAAYHKNDGVTANYWDYPTSTDAVPYSDQPPGTDAPTQSNTANWFGIDDGIANGYNDGYAVSGSPNYNSVDDLLTDVGAYTASLSPYGTFDQGGNVHEWNERVTAGPRFDFREIRGGGWGDGYIGGDDFDFLVASWRLGFVPSERVFDVGFRVASVANVPEPCSLLLGALGCLMLLQRRRR